MNKIHYKGDFKMENTNQNIYGRCHLIKDWPEWELSIHDNEEQINRQGRAMHYPFTFKIHKDKKTARFSSTTSLPYYDTSLSSCTCFDFQERNLPCKHVYRLAVELGIIEIIDRHKSYKKEELNKIRNSSDVDSHPEQIKRQEKSMKCNPIEINYQDETAIFAGSGKNPYTTTTQSCTCRDYILRKLPCKHIYRLRYELTNQ